MIPHIISFRLFQQYILYIYFVSTPLVGADIHEHCKHLIGSANICCVGGTEIRRLRFGDSSQASVLTSNAFNQSAEQKKNEMSNETVRALRSYTRYPISLFLSLSCSASVCHSPIPIWCEAVFRKMPKRQATRHYVKCISLLSLICALLMADIRTYVTKEDHVHQEYINIYPRSGFSAVLTTFMFDGPSSFLRYVLCVLFCLSDLSVYGFGSILLLALTAAELHKLDPIPRLFWSMSCFFFFFFSFCVCFFLHLLLLSSHGLL